MKHVNQSHKADLKTDQESASIAQSSEYTPKQKTISEALVPVMRRSHRDALTEDLVRNLNLVFFLSHRDFESALKG
jgi:hypothetical protein